MARSPNSKVETVFRLNSCGCGCKGRDPWHRTKFKRVVDKKSPREGYVRLPFSNSPVRVYRSFDSGPWFIDWSSVQHDKA